MLSAKEAVSENLSPRAPTLELHEITGDRAAAKARFGAQEMEALFRVSPKLSLSAANLPAEGTVPEAIHRSFHSLEGRISVLPDTQLFRKDLSRRPTQRNNTRWKEDDHVTQEHKSRRKPRLVFLAPVRACASL